MAVIDCFTYNGEKDLLKLHLSILDPLVDEFVIVEAPTTFSGKPKTLYGLRDMHLVKQFWPKIKYHVIDENYTQEELDLAESSPNTQGAEHWKREFLQKESIKKALSHVENDDIVYIGDVDEIWNRSPHNIISNEPLKLRLKVYTYFLNNRSSEQFWGTVMGKWRTMKNDCLNHIRTNANRSDGYNGWHFTSMGGYEEVRRKLEDSYTRESYFTEGVENNLKANIESNQDFLGRKFIYNLDETEWPPYLKEHKHEYKHLLR